MKKTKTAKHKDVYKYGKHIVTNVKACVYRCEKMFIYVFVRTHT